MDPATASDLSQHANALRALARQLVGDQFADDLVQDASLAALRSPPEQRGGIGAWLAEVLRNLASNHRRAGARRARHERQAPPPSSQDAAARIAEQHELVQKVTAALLALPEPYHGTLLLRFFEDLTPTAIAQATGVPLATVKSRLQRGVALLRERMDGAAGGKDWRGAIAGAFGLGDVVRPGTAAAAGVVAGGVLMGTGTKLVSAALAAGLAVAAWLAWNPEPGSSVPFAGPQAASAAPVVAAPTNPDATAPRSDERILREAAPVAAAALERPLATVRGRCVDENGAPLAGVDVKLTGTPESGEVMDAWTKDHDVPTPVDEARTTGSDGTFEFRFWPAPPMRHGLSFRGDGRADMTGPMLSLLVEGQERDLGDVCMPRGSRLRGRVVDTNGAPVAGAHVMFAPGSRPAIPPNQVYALSHARARADADGAFVTEPALPAGEYRIRVHDTKGTPERVSVDGTLPFVDVEIVVEPRAARLPIRGVVVDERGQPIAGADVALLGHAGIRVDGENFALTDGIGSFTIAGPRRVADKTTLLVRRPGFEELMTEPIAWGRDDVRFVLRRALALEVTVVAAADGTPIERYQVRVLPAPHPDRAGGEMRVRGHGRHPGGKAVIDGIARGEWLVIVEPAGDEYTLEPSTQVRVEGPGPSSVTVRLQRTVEQHVRVRAAAGAAIAGTRIELASKHAGLPTADTMAFPLTSPMWWRDDSSLLLDTAITDAEGRARVRGPANTPLLLFVRGPGHVPSLVHPVQLDAEREIAVTAGAGASLVGRVTPMEGIADLRCLADLPPAGTVEVLQRGFLPGVRLSRVDGGRTRYQPERPVTIGDDGTFRLDGLTPGCWDVLASWSERGAGAAGKNVQHAPVASVELRDGATSELVVDLSSLRLGEIDGLLLHNGEPLAQRQVQIELVDARATHRYQRVATTDGGGHFRLRTRGGEYIVVSQVDRTILSSSERAQVIAGHTATQTFTLRSGTLRFRVVDDQGKPVAGARVDMRREGAGAGDWTSPPRTDATGATRVEVDAVPVVVAILPERLQDPAAQSELLQRAGTGDPFDGLRIDLGRFVPVAGQTTDIELRLPAAWRR